MSYVVVKFQSGRELRLETADEEVVAVVFDGRLIEDVQDEQILRDMRDSIDKLLGSDAVKQFTPSGELDPETPISALRLPTRPYDCLRRARIDTVGELIQWGEEDLLGLTNLGEKSLGEIKEVLDEHALHLNVKSFTGIAQTWKGKGTLSQPYN